MPPTFENNILDYVDLDLDILVWKDFSYEILDEDEFKENAEIFGYENKILKNVEHNVTELLKMIRQNDFPFSINSLGN
jgi:protein associated with RNAse G/E